MKRLEIFEDYFVNIYKKFGVCKIRVEGDKVNLEEKDLKKWFSQQAILTQNITALFIIAGKFTNTSSMVFHWLSNKISEIIITF